MRFEKGNYLMNELVFTIVFSLALLPFNFCCAFWIFQAAINLTGMTFRELLGYSSDTVFPSGRAGLRRRRRFLTRFFREKSSQPEKSIRLLWAFGYCTLPGLAALLLAQYAAASGNENKLTYALIGDLLLLLFNIALACVGRVYRKKHPLDEALRAKRAQEKQAGRKRRARNIIVYSIVGAFFFAILLAFHLGIAGVSSARRAGMEIHSEDVKTVLAEKGFETENIPVTYWFYDENRLMYVCAGVKGESKFEFYEYTGDGMTDGVYDRIVQDIAPDMDPAQRESHETPLPGGRRMFSAITDGAYRLVLYQGGTLVYAYSPESLEEINDILFELGYLKER